MICSYIQAFRILNGALQSKCERSHEQHGFSSFPIKETKDRQNVRYVTISENEQFRPTAQWLVCEHGIKPSVSIKGVQCYEKLSDW